LLANALLEGLKNHGAREIFGIPGDLVLPFFKTILLSCSSAPRERCLQDQPEHRRMKM
jgi:hypothetical protein